MIAANLAQQRMEIAMRKPFENLNILNESLQYIDQYGNPTVSLTDFRRETIISENYSGDSHLTQIKVKVYYKSYGYRVGVVTDHGLKILKGELVDKDWNPSAIELNTVMVDN
jgi:hypothetical protein